MFKSLWPIERKDLPKFLPTFLMGLLICFNYALLRCLKDAVVVTASDVGAGVIPFLKMWGVLPAALLSTMLMSRLYRKLSRSQVFYLVISSFLVYFLLFGLVIYPLREALALDRLAFYLHAHLPAGFAAPIEVLRDWPLSLFYIVCELWKVLVLMLAFWGFVNAMSSIEEAKRYFAPLMVGGSVAMMLAGQTSSMLKESGNWNVQFAWLLGLVTACGVAVILLFRWLSKRIILSDAPTVQKQERSPRSVLEAFKMVTRSPILLSMSLCIVADYIAFNLVEVLWKEEMRLLYPNPAQYAAYTGKVLVWTGILGIIGSLFVSGNIIRKSGWTAIALMTPIILLITSIAFFSFLAFKITALAVFIGAVHNCLCRAARQAFLDPAKEIAYVHLNRTLQTQGKTFVDGMSPTLGKSSSALIQQGLLIAAPAMVTPYSAIIVILALITAFAGTVRVGSLLSAEALPAKA